MQLDPLDTLLYTALVHAVGPEIEALRLPAADGIGLSHRYAPSADGDLWQQDSNWSAFIARMNQLAEDPGVTHVLKADIADFFPRIYHHRLQNRLEQATSEKYYTRAIMNMLSGWGGGVSYGIPIGPAASRLIAELLLDPIDRMLVEQDFKHCRWIDDFRIFCHSEAEAKRAEVQLLRTLYESYGLTLQYPKTSITTKERFREHEPREIILVTDPDGEVFDDDTFVEEVREILNETGQVSLAPIQMNLLPVPLQRLIEDYDLNRVLRFLLEIREDIDIGLVRIVVEELGRREDFGSAVIIFEHLDELLEIISTIVIYFHDGREIIAETLRERIGRVCLAKAAELLSADQEYAAMWFLSLISESISFDNQSRLARQFDETASEVARREIILALGTANNGAWFLAQRKNVLGMQPWIRRAFLYGSRSMLADERAHWLKSIKSQLDVLEKATVT